MSFLNSVIKELDNEYAGIVEDGVAAGDCGGFVDTGSYIFNALLSGSIFGGYLTTRLQLSLVSHLLEKLSLLCQSLNTSFNKILLEK